MQPREKYGWKPVDMIAVAAILSIIFGMFASELAPEIKEAIEGFRQQLTESR